MQQAQQTRPVDAMTESVLASQAMGLALMDVMRELMLDMARLHRDPECYLGALYDRIGLSDHVAGEQAQPVVGAARSFVVDLFAAAVTELRSTSSRG